MPLHDDYWLRKLQWVKDDDSETTQLVEGGDENYIQDMSDEGWEELGRDIANNTHLIIVELCGGALNDRNMPFLFRGLTRSTSIRKMLLHQNGLSAVGVRSMVPFLQNANKLRLLDLDDNNNLQSEGFNMLLRELCNSPIWALTCIRCGIESIEIKIDHFPKHLTNLNLDGNNINSIDIDIIPKHLMKLNLSRNNINADGCREVAKLLKGGDSMLTTLDLSNNKIDDDGVEILVDALQSNASLKTLNLRENNDISNQGKISLLKLVIDISSIKATLQSNYTLEDVKVVEDINPDGVDPDEIETDIIQRHIDMAVDTNSWRDPEEIGREKMIEAQLHSVNRAELADLQGVGHSVYSEIDPLHLPEVLFWISARHGQGELFVALKSSIIGLFSRVDMKKCLQKQAAYHEARIADHEADIAYYRAVIDKHASIIAEHGAKIKELNARVALMGDSDENVTEGMKTHDSKRRRVDG